MFGFLDNIKYITKRFKVASPANKREMFEIFCENLIWDGKNARWDWKKPYYHLAKISKKYNDAPPRGLEPRTCRLQVTPLFPTGLDYLIGPKAHRALLSR